MYQVIKDYFDLRLAEFNAMNSDYLVETSITLNRDRLPLNQRQANYSIKLDNFNSSESQSESYSVSGEVELTFSMVNKKIIDYEAVQEYIYKLARYIRRKENYTSANKHFGIISIGGEDLNNLNEGSTELSTKLVFEGEYYETNTVTLTVPSAPTLTSPADLYLSGLTNQSFQWSDVSGAITYTFELSNTSGVVFTQTGLRVSSYTIPADSLLTNGSVYQWRVRATGEGGSSAWSGYFTFTVNDSFSYEPETLAYQTRVLADAGEIISLDAVNDAILDAKTNGYWNNVRSWVDPQFGVKKSGTAISKLYCLTGFDIIGTNTPTYNATGLNSLPSVDFNGTANYMTVPNVGLGLTSAEVFIAGIRDADPPTDPTSGFWFYGTQSGVDNHVPYADGSIYDGWGTSVRKTVGNPASSLASKFLYNISTASGAWTARLNGTQIYTTATNTVGFRTAPILGKSEGAYFYKGKFGGMLLLNTVASTTQRGLINTFFNTKYAIY